MFSDDLGNREDVRPDWDGHLDTRNHQEAVTDNRRGGFIFLVVIHHH